MINPPKEENIVEKLKHYQMYENLKLAVLNLQRYNCVANSGGQDCWVEMEEDKDGDFLKLEDVLNLFSAK